jgi:hypothetical protein
LVARSTPLGGGVRVVDVVVVVGGSWVVVVDGGGGSWVVVVEASGGVGSVLPELVQGVWVGQFQW